eukprot:scaffold317_cov260-Pinguiococcus_pyrenoidosus.AAC.4
MKGLLRMTRSEASARCTTRTATASRASGTMTSRTAVGDSTTRAAMYMMGCGKMAERMDSVRGRTIRQAVGELNYSNGDIFRGMWEVPEKAPGIHTFDGLEDDASLLFSSLHFVFVVSLALVFARTTSLLDTAFLRLRTAMSTTESGMQTIGTALGFRLALKTATCTTGTGSKAFGMVRGESSCPTETPLPAYGRMVC